MKILLRSTEKIPEYALSYLVNGDDSGLEPEEKKIIDTWVEKFQSWAKDNQIVGYFEISPLDTEPFFTHYPAFGLACTIQECDILILG